MATHVATQTQVVVSPVTFSNQISIYGHPSPTSSTVTSPVNNSPTSPRLSNSGANVSFPLQTRQLRPPKAPLYVPAALRPTERPLKPSPPATPPRSVHGSLDSSNETEAKEPALGGRRSSAAMVSKLAEEEWMKHEHLGEVTGLPTREHWKADSASSNCDSPTCRSSFGLFLRRHHCRHCGHVFCSSHTPHLVPLNQDAQFHPDGIWSRACDLCWSAYQRWLEVRSSRLSQIQSALDAQNTGNLDSPEASLDDSQPPLPDIFPRPSEIAASVPRDWNWSTF